MRWCVVNTKPKKEDYAARQLEVKGLEVFLPRIEVARKRGSKKYHLLEPLFPGYLFVKIKLVPDSVPKVNWTPGVRRLLCAEDIPLPVPDAAIDLIHRRIGPRGHLSPRPEEDFPAGSSVAVRYGPFAGLVGVVERPTSGRNRVRVLMELLQRETAIEFDAVDLERL